MIKAIIIDLDGTTLPRNWHQISEENRVALEEAGQQGVVRILATGRSVFSLNNTLPEGLPVDYMVFSSGAGIMHWADKEILLTRELSAEETQEPMPTTREMAISTTTAMHKTGASVARGKGNEATRSAIHDELRP